MIEKSGIDTSLDIFIEERTQPLDERYKGYYRAIVKDTNDPLQMHRIRFLCPEMHDIDLQTTDCPWAVPAPEFAGKGSGAWCNVCIGDIIFITFEKNHPYCPIWVAGANPTMRGFYPLESTYIESKTTLNEDGKQIKNDAYNADYLPSDRRPMSHGWKNRYGSLELHSSVGFAPVEHQSDPAFKPDLPDMKYSVNLTKYGTYAIASDVGYSWLLSGEMGEFRGDWTVDRDFEGKRYLYYQKLFNESAPSHDDQRRYEIRTRAGHKFEMRDVGWAQIGGAVSGKEIISGGKTRDEFGPAQTISNNTSNDQRWVKLNSKGGHLIELMDAGFHPNDDKLYSTNLIDDCGATFEDGWENRDARQVRFISRHGFKFVLDDRGSDPVDATGLQTPHGNGWLLKTRRSFDNAGKGVGFGFEANDKDEIDSTKIYTPKSKVFELNDKLNFIMLCTDTKELLPRDWAGVLENEFTLSSVLTQDPEHSTFHLKLDNQNGYLRLKTSVGMDNGLRQFPTPFPDSLTDVSGTAICQGLEARDGRVGNDGPWAEVVDVDNRGMWFSHNYKLGIWRARTGKQEYIAVQDSDGAESIVIYNNNGKVQIYSRGQISIVSESNVVIQAGGTISLNADRVIAKGSINAQEFNGSFIGAQSGSGAGTPSGGAITPESIVQPSKTFPSDRAMSMLQDSPTPEGVIKNT